jgi:hypothetical protein
MLPPQCSSQRGGNWKPLWFSQLRLKLDDQNFPDPSIFQKMFNSFIENRHKDLPIHSFHLICRHNHYSKTDFPNILYPVVERRVQNLNIDLSHSVFPTFVLITKFLSVLKLMRLLLDEIPRVELPSLKFLRLESVTFTYYDYLINILSACPNLEELETKDLIVKTGYMMPCTLLASILCITSLKMRSICNYMWYASINQYIYLVYTTKLLSFLK